MLRIRKTTESKKKLLLKTKVRKSKSGRVGESLINNEKKKRKPSSGEKKSQICN